MKQLSILLGLFLCFTFGAVAQESNTSVQHFNLNQAIDYALKHNRDIQNSRLDEKLAKKKVWETTAMGLPQADVSFDYTYIFDDDIPIPFMGGSTTIKFEPTSNVRLQVNQLIFSGEYIVGLKTSKIFKSLSQQNIVKTEQETVEAITNAFIGVLVLQKNFEILKENKTTIEQNIFEMQQMFEAGFIENTDVDQLKITKRNIENTLSNIKKQIDLGKMLLKINMGLPTETAIALSQDLDSMIEQLISGTLNDTQFTAENNIDYQLLETQKQLKIMELRQQQVQFSPKISGFYSHLEKLKPPVFDLTPKDLIGVKVALPLFSSGARISKVQQAKIELDKMENTQAALNEGLNMQFQQAMLSYKTAFNQYLNEKENVELANRINEKTRIKYREGLSSSLDLSQVQTQFLQAQTNYFNAILSLVQAKTLLDKLMFNPQK